MKSESIITDKVIFEFSKGQEIAFRQLYDKYVEPLRYFASKYFCDKDQIDDIVQDSFICLYEKRKSFSNENAIKAFLYRKTANDCISVIRHVRVKNKYIEVKVQSEKSDSFLENIIQTEVFTLVMKAFHELTPACQQVYQLSLDGKSQDEIAKLLNISINTVKKHKNNANHYMRGRLKTFLNLLFWLYRKMNSIEQRESRSQECSTNLLKDLEETSQN